MQVTYQSRKYTPDAVHKRYVRRSGDGYQFCEVGADARWDVRQGTVEAEELSESVRAAADASKGYAFGYVEWPISKS